MSRSALCLAVVLLACSPCAATLMAGAAKYDATVPIGAPLAGLSARKTAMFPLFTFDKNYTTWMQPSTGVSMPTWAKAVMIDTGSEQLMWVTLDAIGADNSIMDLVYGYAAALGVTVPRDNCILSASHSHSGPGAISTYFLWNVAPAMDMCVATIRDGLARDIAQAMWLAQQALQPAVLDIGITQSFNFTHNRRAGKGNPYVQLNSVDPNIAVMRIDNAQTGAPIATLWNFAMHGTCLGEDNLLFSGDIMGGVNQWLETQSETGIALFVNADAGDVDPDTWLCAEPPFFLSGAPVLGAAVLANRAAQKPTANVELSVFSQQVDFGLTDWNITLARFDNCTSGGVLDICGICKILDCTLPLHLNDGWIETVARFTALRFTLNGSRTVGVVTIPGEALVELGKEIRSDLLAMNFDQVMLSGYSNNHMAYFATPDEYMWGGYESQLTFWGIGTSAKVRAGCKGAAGMVAI